MSRFELFFKNHNYPSSHFVDMEERYQSVPVPVLRQNIKTRTKTRQEQALDGLFTLIRDNEELLEDQLLWNSTPREIIFIDTFKIHDNNIEKDKDDNEDDDEIIIVPQQHQQLEEQDEE